MNKEKSIRSRVKYLEQAQIKLAQKISVIQARNELKERVAKAKEEEILRQALRQTRDEALQEKRRSIVKDKLIARI